MSRLRSIAFEATEDTNGAIGRGRGAPDYATMATCRLAVAPAHGPTPLLRLTGSGLVLTLLALACASPTEQQGQPPAEPGEQANAAERPSPASGPPLENEAWTLLNMATAHGALVIELEARDPDRALEIARALVEPVKDGYTQVLVYVYPAGAEPGPPAHRIEWTPGGGYVDLDSVPTSGPPAR